MSSKTFKLSTLAAMVMAATSANAALYTIDLVSEPINDSKNPNSNFDNEHYSTAIQETSNVNNCFREDCTADSTKVATRGRLGEAGQFINHEVDLQFDNRLNMVLESDIRYQYLKYCEWNYKYETCTNWADRYTWGNGGSGGANKIINSWGQTFNADNNNTKGYVDGTRLDIPTTVGTAKTSTITGTQEVVVNSIADNGDLIANISSGYVATNSGNSGRNYKSRAIVSKSGAVTELPSFLTSGIGALLAPTRAFDEFEYDGKNYAVGSAASDVFNSRSCSNTTNPEESSSCQNTIYNSKASVWELNTPAPIQVANWNGFSGTSPGNSNSINSSIRGAAIAAGGTYDALPVLAGYNATNGDSRSMLQAAVFLPNTTGFTVATDQWTSKTVAGTELKSGSDWLYSNSTATDINNKLIVIGTSKRGSFDYIRGSSSTGNTDIPVQNGSLNNRLWVADASTGSPTADYLSGGIFFDGAGGEMGAINNHNEIVGRVHAETSREVQGKVRRERGFILPYGADADRKDTFNSKAWWLDDLTNDGSQSGNANKYRILDANDINDAGIIAATAVYCSIGYKTTSHNSECGEPEKKVAIKLIPINGATSANIQVRSTDSNPVTRKGAGLGWMFLAGLTLFGFRRK
ncbi:DUF3466 family protein [Vibrio tapetis subsp. quintayensis]|uniref:DUF3466 family protein n=1 Tax=Vibrio tapetis TaxID=52443 RepID=UPI0025B5435B|nr:DUF3466 family protein [Vibrio tapetis]MDN3679193.1 DUF3466 family protein [Vibrio tapetis subsp. quintayensis]